jgi:hypothetical protein
MEEIDVTRSCRINPLLTTKVRCTTLQLWRAKPLGNSPTIESHETKKRTAKQVNPNRPLFVCGWLLPVDGVLCVVVLFCFVHQTFEPLQQMHIGQREKTFHVSIIMMMMMMMTKGSR